MRTPQGVVTIGSKDLLDCPNCGIQPKLETTGVVSAYWLQCPKCGKDGEAYFNPSQAREAWNAMVMRQSNKADMPK